MSDETERLLSELRNKGRAVWTHPNRQDLANRIGEAITALEAENARLREDSEIAPAPAGVDEAMVERSPDRCTQSGERVMDDILEVVAKHVGKTSNLYRFIRDDLATLSRPAGGEWVMVPKHIHVSPDRWEAAQFAFGGPGSNADEPFYDCTLWVGEIENDDGSKTHGLHVSCDECPEEGSITLSEFPEAPTPHGGELTDEQIGRALDTRMGLDHILRQLVRGGTMTIGYSKADVVRALLAAITASQKDAS